MWVGGVAAMIAKSQRVSTDGVTTRMSRLSMSTSRGRALKEGQGVPTMAIPAYVCPSDPYGGTVRTKNGSPWVHPQNYGFNFGTWLFGRGAQVPWEYVVHTFNATKGVEWNKLACFGIGAAVMGLLTALHYQIPWWPINPIGFPVGIVFKVRWSVFPIFLGWLLRLSFSTAGGTRLVRKMKPFFNGLMLGWFAGAGLSVIVDWVFFFGDGHVIYWH